MKKDQTWNKICDLLGKLSGKETRADTMPPTFIDKNPLRIGYSQFNEILLLLGMNRVSRQFFQYLVNQTTDIDTTSYLDLSHFEKGVQEARKLFLLVFGNVRFGFKQFSEDYQNNTESLVKWVEDLQQVPEESFAARHDPVLMIQEIPKQDTFYLGYMIEKEISEKIKEDPSNISYQNQEEKRIELVNIGKSNQQAYLASDHMDVYVATSMRKKHEFYLTNETVNQIFNSQILSRLKLRYFDPTQAYCKNRIDKGLAEALMLSRATCTIYLAQESDTLGKDSELAVTLAQGKPVIAFVPEGDEQYLERLIENYCRLEKSDRHSALVYFFKTFAPDKSWTDQNIRKWLDGELEEQAVLGELYSIVKQTYDARARTLKELHPLGIQVNINTGLAIGVLVVRTIEDCIKLVESIILKKLKFDLEEKEDHLILVESISQSVYRVMTKDHILSNSFWNFY